MMIQNYTIENYITGSVRFEEINGFLFPRRFTEKESTYVAKNDFLNPGSKMTCI